MTIIGPRERSNRLAVSAAFAVQGLLFAVLLTHLPQFKDRWHIGDGVVTLLILGVTILAGVGSVLTETLAARRGSAFALMAALTVIVLAAGCIAAAPARWAFVTAFGVYGVGLGGVDAASNMQAVALQHRYGRSILTSFHATWSAAGIVGALYVAAGSRLGLGLGVSIGIAVVALALTVVAMRGRLIDARRGGVQPSLSTHASEVDVPWRAVLLLGSAMACFYVADAGTSNWSAIYLHDLLHASDGVAALAYAGYQASSLAARIAGDHLVRRSSAVTVVRVGAVVGIVGLAIAVLAPGAAVAIAGFTILGAGVTVTAPLCFSAAGQLSPDAIDAVVARVNVFNYVGALVGGVAVGAVGSLANLRIGFIVPLLLVVVLLGLSKAFAPQGAVTA